MQGSDLRALGGLDLLGKIDHAGVDALLSEDDVAHLDCLLMVRDHPVREIHVGLVVGGRLGCCRDLGRR